MAVNHLQNPAGNSRQKKKWKTLLHLRQLCKSKASEWAIVDSEVSRLTDRNKYLGDAIDLASKKKKKKKKKRLMDAHNWTSADSDWPWRCCGCQDVSHILIDMQLIPPTAQTWYVMRMATHTISITEICLCVSARACVHICLFELMAMHAALQ